MPRYILWPKPSESMGRATTDGSTNHQKCCVKKINPERISQRMETSLETSSDNERHEHPGLGYMVKEGGGGLESTQVG